MQSQNFSHLLFKVKLNGNEEQIIKLKEGQSKRKTQKHDTKKCDTRGKIFTINVPSPISSTPFLSESILFSFNDFSKTVMEFSLNDISMNDI